ncbi:MAG: NDP-sugar synthase [Solirubrobacterales bacterium]|nr:NDP-sugar synthase [Solirubrobacterales bacterium]
MQALVLVGGKGTRLRPLTTEIPKPILTLVDRPFLSYMIEWLGSHGVDEVVLACGFLPDQLEEVLGDGEPGGPSVRYLVEPEPLGTGGAIRFALPELEERFFALNGDVLTDLDLSALWDSHLDRGARASLGLYPVEDPTGYGLVDLADDGRVLDFHEKPEPGHAGAGLINAGTYVLEKSAFDGVPEGREVSIEREIFPGLVGNGLYGVRLDGYWVDIGTPDRYLDASWDIIEGRVTTEVETDPSGVHVDPGATISGEATIGPRAVVASGCTIGPGAEVTGSVLLDGCEIGKDAVVSNSILSAGVNVAAGANVSDRVLGKQESVNA